MELGGPCDLKELGERAYGGGWRFSSGWRYPQGNYVIKAGKFLYLAEKQFHKACQRKHFLTDAYKINNHYKSDHDLEVILKLKWGLERHCDVIFWLLSRLVWEVKQIKLIMFGIRLFVCEWSRTVSYCFPIFTCDLQHQKFLWFIQYSFLL